MLSEQSMSARSEGESGDIVMWEVADSDWESVCTMDDSAAPQPRSLSLTPALCDILIPHTHILCTDAVSQQ